MVPFLKGMPSAMSDKMVKTFINSNQVHIDIPLQEFNWELFIGKTKTFFGTNFMAFIMFLSGGLALFHYEKILSCIGKEEINNNFTFTLSVLG